MAGKAGGRSGLAKNPKKTKPKDEQEEDDNLLDNLVMEKDTDKTQPTYSTLEPGSFVMKAADRKTRLDKRHVKIAAAAGKPDEGQEEEMEQERLEREADELTSQLKKAERAEEKEKGKGTKRQSQTVQPEDNKWTVSKATESCNASGSQKEEKVDEDGGYCQRGRRGGPRQHSGGFSSSRRKSPLHKHDEGG